MWLTSNSSINSRTKRGILKKSTKIKIKEGNIAKKGNKQLEKFYLVDYGMSYFSPTFSSYRQIAYIILVTNYTITFQQYKLHFILPVLA